MKNKILLTGFGILFLNAGVATADLDSLQNYDNFNAKKTDGCKSCLDSEKWRGLQRGDYTTEIVREVKSKKARLMHRSWGRSDSDAGREQGRNRMNFRNSVDFSGACFTPKIKKYEVKNCAANGDSSNVRVRYVGNFYDTGVTNDDGEIGVVYAWINMSRSVDFPTKKDRFHVWGAASECTDANCDTEGWTTYDDTNDPDLDFGVINGKKNKKAMCIGFDRMNNTLVFSYGNDVRVVNSADHDLPALGSNLSANQTWHVIETRGDIENCSTGPVSGAIDVEVDNVKIREYQ